MAATLLLADDSVTIQRVIELTFANEGIRAITVADGNAVTSRLEDERPDIVLADVGLPSVDGYEIAERIKRSPALSSLPVLLLTGAFEPIDEARARATGCDGVLVKPFEPRHLVGVVKGLLAGQRPDNLWPTDMPRIDSPRRPEPVRPAHPVRPATGERGPLRRPSMVEEVFTIALDDLDTAFSRTVPIEDVTPVDDMDLDWDLPAPATLIASSPLDAHLPVGLTVPAPPAPASAVSALPAAAQAQPVAAKARVSRQGTTSRDLEDIVRRVMVRMTDEVVQKLVSETAERLIREEMDRLKR